ncbi:MAG: hypothetical protein M4579_005509, partial [Chaenotheca gracillima]
MSLYYEAASILASPTSLEGPLKSYIYRQKHLKSSPGQTYALVVETLKWNEVLKDVIENAQLLRFERKLTPELALLLVHDLLLAKKGIAAPASHPVRLVIEKHKSRLQAEFTKIRVRRKFPTLAAFQQQINQNAELGDEHAAVNSGSRASSIARPRWVRVNALRTTLENQLSSTFAEFRSVQHIAELAAPQGEAAPHSYFVDLDVPDLVALHPKSIVTSNRAYLEGRIILQDKASCFPAYMLTHGLETVDVIDACAAPGNKTTHVAALLNGRTQTDLRTASKIYAIERDAGRSETLRKMVSTAGAEATVSILAKTDFLDLEPLDRRWHNVTSILLDPSCSGSGMVARDESHQLILPSSALEGSRSKKRKRSTKIQPVNFEPTTAEHTQEIQAGTEDVAKRLSSLAVFQRKMLEHAFQFPSCQRIVYSTCSIHNEENEHVVVKALESTVARQQGWKILTREKQPAGLRKWKIRGNAKAFEHSKADQVETGRMADACIRCNKNDTEGTMGFFVAGFERE